MKNKIEVVKVKKTLLEKKANDKHRQLVASARFSSMPSQTASLSNVYYKKRRAIGFSTLIEECGVSYLEVEFIAI